VAQFGDGGRPFRVLGILDPQLVQLGGAGADVVRRDRREDDADCRLDDKRQCSGYDLVAALGIGDARLSRANSPRGLA